MCSLRLRTSLGLIATSQKLSVQATKHYPILMQIHAIACAKILKKLVLNASVLTSNQKNAIVGAS